MSAKAKSYGMTSAAVDGMDVTAVEGAGRQALDHIAKTGRPFLLECRTYRFRAHSMFDAQLYRDKEEVAQWRQKGPIVRFQNWLEQNQLLHAEEIEEITAEVDREIAEAVAFAEAGTDEPVETLTRHVVSDEPPVAPQPAPKPVPDSAARKVTYREAVKTAITDALTRDDRVFLMGEDVGKYGGCYAVSKGLFNQFGGDRIRDTPLSESGFTGAGIGAAIAGMRPIVEVMTVNFSLLALDQILNTAATFRHMSNNQFGVPVVIRMATGAGKQLAAQHSHSLEGWYAHIPGLRVLTPATIEDAHGMLLSALEDPDPVLIFENVMLYNTEGQLRENAGPVDINRAAVRKPGSDISLITYGGSLFKTLEAARLLEQEGVSAEVIDLRVLRPLDMDTILASVTKTHRALIVDEGWKSGSLAAEIGMRLAEDAFFELDAPLARLCSAEVPIPYARHLEQAAIPQVDKIVAAVKSVMEQQP
ncbi:pyruvate dehydrogenase complex E1 component subunit beta [Pseudophaeobacter sp.]|uniref:pyruvate dehydrogenase complex E1 component subunit beta n=1 Tax=Pseudophaeobacter sp. TaxID=1971739 RepID=UPI0032987B49